jgi:hypothetical protein
MLAKRENLIVVRAGPKSLHPSWLDAGRDRSFDLLVAAYSPEAPKIEAAGITNILLPGRKVRGFSDVFNAHSHVLSDYRHIALIDDDIAATQSDLDLCFSIGKQKHLNIWQPSLSWESYFSYASTLTNPSFSLRYVSFVEMMCPFFEVSYLRRVLPLFDLGYETGIDLIWTRLMSDPWLKAAVIDEVAVTHTKEVGLQKQLQGFRPNERYDVQMAEVLAFFGASFRGPVCYAALSRSNRLTMNRCAIALRSLTLLNALRRTPMRRLVAARLIGAYIRHTMTLGLQSDDLSRSNAGGIRFPAETDERYSL